MGFLRDRIEIKNERLSIDGATTNFLNSMGLDTSNISNVSELRESTYFICLKTLSETLSKMKWFKRLNTKKKGKEKVEDQELNILLNIRPNSLYNSNVFWSTIELNRLHHGNAYAYIEANKRTGRPNALWILPSEEVSIWRDNKTILGDDSSIWYVWNDPRTGKSYKFQQGEILHFKTSMSFNGLAGTSVREMLKQQINGKIKAVEFLNKLYSSNMFGGKVLLHYAGELNKKNANNVAMELESSGTIGSGRFIPMPLGMEAKMMDMKLTDAQFLENNKLSSLQIAAAFGIKPNMINDYTKSSYSNSETQQLDFYVNTLQPCFEAYMQEVTYKLLPMFELKKGYSIEIDEKTLFKMDNKTKAEVYSKYLNNFVMTPNEVREEIGIPYSEGADELIGNGNYIKIGQIGAQWNKGE